MALEDKIHENLCDLREYANMTWWNGDNQHALHIILEKTDGLLTLFQDMLTHGNKYEE